MNNLQIKRGNKYINETYPALKQKARATHAAIKKDSERLINGGFDYAEIIKSAESKPIQIVHEKKKLKEFLGLIKSLKEDQQIRLISKQQSKGL